MQYRFILLLVLVSIKSVAQSDSTENSSGKKFKPKHQIMGSLGYSLNAPNYFRNKPTALNWNNLTWNSQWLEFGYAFGQIDSATAVSQALNVKEWRIGMQFPIKKWMAGKRERDIKGFLLVPSLGAHFAKTSFNRNDKIVEMAKGLNVTPALSLQFPFAALDMKMHFDFRSGSLSYVKPVSVYPEFVFRLDGLYNLFDPQYAYSHTAKGVDRSIKASGGSKKTQVDAYSTHTVTTTTTTTNYEITETPYSMDVYSNDIGPFWSIGPKVILGRSNYAGNTNLYGINVSRRKSMWGFDLGIDAGKLGFASRMKDALTENTKYAFTLGTSDFNKLDYVSRGALNCTRFGIRGSMDALAALSLLSAHGGKGISMATKFTRWNFGLGAGYAILSNPQFEYSNGETAANTYLSSIANHAKSSVNHIKYAKSSPFFQYFTTLEVGAVVLSYEQTLYFNAIPASTPNVSVAYLFPLKRGGK